MTKLNMLPKEPNPYLEILNKYKTYFIVACIIVFFIGLGTGVLTSLYHDHEVRMKLMADVKERCKPVYKTINTRNVTTIYTCPDDTQYEFTERL